MKNIKKERPSISIDNFSLNNWIFENREMWENKENMCHVNVSIYWIDCVLKGYVVRLTYISTDWWIIQKLDHYVHISWSYYT